MKFEIKTRPEELLPGRALIPFRISYKLGGKLITRCCITALLLPLASVTKSEMVKTPFGATPSSGRPTTVKV